MRSQPRAFTGCDASQALGHAPLHAEALYHLGLAQDDAGDARGADGTLRASVLAAQAAREDPPGELLPAALLVAGRAALDGGRVAAATTLLERAARRPPGRGHRRARRRGSAPRAAPLMG